MTQVAQRMTADECRAVPFDVALELGVEDELGSPLLPGFALRLSSLFGD